MSLPVQMPLVAICVPSGDMVHADFALSLATLCLNPGADTCIINCKNSIIALGRNQCVAAAEMVKATHILFLDSDMVFPPDTLKRLLVHNKDVMGAMYSKRVPPFYPLGTSYDGDKITVTSGLQRMKTMPTGCLLIKTAVFEKIKKPYFNFATENEKIIGEDFYFCQNAIAAGFEIWCDVSLSLELGHIGQQIHKLTSLS